MSLINLLKTRIAVDGSITLHDFMHIVLYDPKYGYYQQEKVFGVQGDFMTAPEISQCFGEMIGVYLAYVQKNFYNQSKFDIVEIGGGRGTLMYDILNSTKHIPGFCRKMGAVHMVEISDNLQRLQRQKLADFRTNINICWYDHLSEYIPVSNNKVFVVANEFFDALPIRQFIMKDGKWYERLVSYNDQLGFHFVFSSNPVDIDWCLQYYKCLSGFDIRVKEGSILEISDDIIGYLQLICSKIKDGGMAIIVDYGYVEQKLQGGLQSLWNHKYNDIFTNIGKADLTYLINFPLFKEIIHKEGISNVDIITQSEFLLQLGIKERVKNIVENIDDKQQKIDMVAAVDRLVDKAQMGELFKVLVCWV